MHLLALSFTCFPIKLYGLSSTFLVFLACCPFYFCLLAYRLRLVGAHCSAALRAVFELLSRICASSCSSFPSLLPPPTPLLCPPYVECRRNPQRGRRRRPRQCCTVAAPTTSIASYTRTVHTLSPLPPLSRMPAAQPHSVRRHRPRALATDRAWGITCRPQTDSAQFGGRGHCTQLSMKTTGT
ncbi:hypothetical protein PLICRDRAFT_497700 [Plicaturopsis crispa FD-325 SS-3]|nr:hypothetical protein PLICRDRAFT_497700 [Plicaturopsis crispa FD-325 SS-3]